MDARLFGFLDGSTLNLIEGATGGRFHPNFNRVGGLKDDLPWGWIAECRRTMDIVFKSCDDFEDLLMANEIFEARTRSIGIIPADVGTSYGVSGSNIRASGVDWDLRRDGDEYLVPRLDFKSDPPDGDSTPAWVRLQETRSRPAWCSNSRRHPVGPIMTRCPGSQVPR